EKTIRQSAILERQPKSPRKTSLFASRVCAGARFLSAADALPSASFRTPAKSLPGEPHHQEHKDTKRGFSSCLVSCLCVLAGEIFLVAARQKKRGDCSPLFSSFSLAG